jgi:flagellar capping protein FliD
MAGFSSTTHPLPAQTVRYTVTNDIINVGDTASSSSGTINIPEGQTLTNFVTAFNGQGNGISASISGTGTSTKLHLEATNPSTAYSFTIDTIPIAVAPVAQVIEMSKTYAAGELVAAETISLTVTANGGGGTTTNFIPDGNQTPAQAVIAFNALNNGITASTFAGGTRLRFAATDPSTAHSFTVGNIPAAGGGQMAATPGSSGSASGVQSITATGNRTWRDSLTENDGVGTDERFADKVTHESGDPAYNWERVEVPPAGSGVYRTDLYTGFQFETTSDQTDMTFYIARSAKTELSRFFKDALSTSGIYRTVVDAYTDEGNTLAKRLDTIDERKLTLQARYTKQFAAMETVVTGGSSTSEFLTNLVAGWNKD